MMLLFQVFLSVVIIVIIIIIVIANRMISDGMVITNRNRFVFVLYSDQT